MQTGGVIQITAIYKSEVHGAVTYEVKQRHELLNIIPHMENDK